LGIKKRKKKWEEIKSREGEGRKEGKGKLHIVNAGR